MNREEEILKATEEMSVAELLKEIDRRKEVAFRIKREEKEGFNFGIPGETYKQYVSWSPNADWKGLKNNPWGILWEDDDGEVCISTQETEAYIKEVMEEIDREEGIILYVVKDGQKVTFSMETIIKFGV